MSEPSKEDVLNAIKRLKAKAQEAELRETEPIAVVGMACRLPGTATSLEGFWNLLVSGTDATSDVPSDRWDVDAMYDPDPTAPGRSYVKRGGFLERSPSEFDASFFGISPREASLMDPQQRIALEVAFEALCDAGIRLQDVRGKRYGVFMGASLLDYFLHLHAENASGYEYTPTGVSHSIIANRISYVFDLQGPSVAVDTACSSSLVALHQGCHSLRARESDVVLAGGVNLLLLPAMHIAFSKLRALAPDGRCKTFDASANGYSRGEGCGVLVLKRLSDAVAAGDRIWALVRGTAVNQDGRSSGLTVPNGQAQERVIRSSLAAARISAQEVSFLEAHGTGTSLGDPVEVVAAANVFSDGRSPSDALAIGSVKTNIGHLEAAAGVAGLIKVILSLHHRRLPRSLNFDKPNPLIPFDRIPLRVQTELAPLPSGRKLYAGVSSFGFGGTNAHATLEEAPAKDVTVWTEADARATRGEPNVLAISAKSEAALARRIEETAAFLSGELIDGTWRDVAYTASARRDHFEHRACVIAGSAKDLAERLRSGDVITGRASERRPKLAFVFAGQGSQWWAMGRELFAEEPVFRTTIEEVSAIVQKLAGWSLTERLLAPEASSPIHQTETAQPALFAVGVALAALLGSWGIVPDAVTGHSVGEIAAAHVAGVLSLARATELAVIRGRIMQKATGLGSMAHVELPANEVAQLLSDYQGRLFVGASNGPSQTVVSGESEAVDALLLRLAERKVFAKKLHVDYAFHTEKLGPLGAELSQALGSLAPGEAATPFFSTVTGASAPGPSLDAAYWGRQLVKPVAFHDATRALIASGHEILLELGPHPVLAQSMSETASTSQANVRVVASLKRKEPERSALLSAAASLHCAGIPVAWEKTFQPRGRLVSIPHYPWQRQRCWVEVSPRSGGAQLHPLLDAHIELATRPAVHLFDASISTERHAWLADHVVGGAVVAPGAFYVASALAAARHIHGERVRGVEGLRFPKLLSLANGARRVQISVEATGEAPRFELRSRDIDGDGAWELNAEGQIALGDAGTPPAARPAEPAWSGSPAPLPSSTLYQRYARIASIAFGGSFQCLVDTSTWVNGAKTSIRLRDDIATQCASFGLHPIVIDACFQAVGAPLLVSDDAVPYLPAGIGSFRVHRPVPDARTVRVTLREGPRDERVLADVVVLDADDNVVIEASEVAFARVGRTTPELENVYRIAYREAPRAAAPTAREEMQWLLVGDGPIARELATELTRAGGKVIVMAHGAAYACIEERRRYEGDLESHEDIGRVLDASSGAAETTIVHLASEAVPTDATRRQAAGLASALALVRALKQRSASPSRVWLVTRGAQQTGGDGDVDVTQASLWGFGATLHRDVPDLAVMLLDVDMKDDAKTVGADVARELVSFRDETENRIALRSGDRRFVARIEPVAALPPRAAEIAVTSSAGYRVDVSGSPRATEIRLHATGAPAAPSAGQLTIRVRASGFAPDELGSLASTVGDCAGEVVAVGDQVVGFTVGDRVVALAESPLAAFVTVRADAAVRIPTALSFEAAAANASPFARAMYAIEDAARLSAGETVLVEDASTDVGLAALQCILQSSARPLAVTRDDSERAAIGASTVEVVSAADSARFTARVRELTRDRGVDVVLRPRSKGTGGPDVVAPFGRVVSVGDEGGSRPLASGAGARSLTASTVLLDELLAHRPERVAELVKRALDGLASGTLKPIPASVHPVTALGDAIAEQARSAPPARIVATSVDRVRVLANDASFRADASYLVTGGLGSLGLVAAQWLVDEGARHLILLGRSKPSAEAEAAIARMRAQGANILIEAADVGDRAAVDRVLASISPSFPLRGVFHVAGILDNAPAPTMPVEKLLGPVFTGKAIGALNLHEATKGIPLDFFVLYSSIAGVIGANGQSNYAAANSLLDALAEHRHAHGLPALSVAWGPWAEVGMAVRTKTLDRFAALGASQVHPAEATRSMKRLLGRDIATVSIVPLDVEKLRASASLSATGFFSALQLPDAARDADDETLAKILATPSAKRLDAIAAFLCERLGAILRLPAKSVPRDGSFHTLGLDSLTILEFRNAIEKRLGLKVPVAHIMNYPTVDELASLLRESLHADGDESLSAAAEVSPTKKLGAIGDAELDAMSDEEWDEALDLDD